MKITLTALPPRQCVYAGGIPYGKQALIMAMVNDGLQRGERIGIGTNDIERWIEAFERQHHWRPTVEPLPGIPDMHVLSKPQHS